MFQPERLTVAAWMTFSGQQVGEGEARELTADELQSQHDEEQCQVGPAAGHLSA